jgi:hypothetical protein
MSDDRKDGPPPAEGLPPFFPMVEDGSAMIRNHSRKVIEVAVTERFGVTDVFGPPLPLVEAAAIPSLLLQTVIVPDARTSEGTLIEVVGVAWFAILRF